MQRARTVEAKEERRQVLLKAALDEFFERGYAAARMDDIAKRANLSKGAVYLYFDSKKALFFALVEAMALPRVADIEGMAAHGLMGLKMLMRAAPNMIRTTPVPKIIKILIAESFAFPDLASDYRKMVVDRGLAALTSMIEHANAAGEIHAPDAQITARLVVAPLIMSAIWHVLFEHDQEAVVNLEDLFTEHERMLFQALGVKEVDVA